MCSRSWSNAARNCIVPHQWKEEAKNLSTKFSQLILHNVRIETRPTFLDYIQNETKLKFIVAVDFTASNGNPSDSNSLHCKDPTGAPSQYITAIESVGDSSNLFVLLIITKGVITDLKATRSAIAQASCLPMSSIIIGVGSKDFSFMNLLDSDDSSGRKAEGDIVQFV